MAVQTDYRGLKSTYKADMAALDKRYADVKVVGIPNVLVRHHDLINIIERIKGYFLYVSEVPRDNIPKSADLAPPVEWLKELNQVEKRLILNIPQYAAAKLEGCAADIRLSMEAFFSAYEDYKSDEAGTIWFSVWKDTIKKIFEIKITSLIGDLKEKPSCFQKHADVRTRTQEAQAKLIVRFASEKAKMKQEKCEPGSPEAYCKDRRLFDLRKTFQEKMKALSEERVVALEQTVAYFHSIRDSLMKEIQGIVRKFTELYGQRAPCTVAFIEGYAKRT